MKSINCCVDGDDIENGEGGEEQMGGYDKGGGHYE
jgi:hypothetical protein